MIAFIQVPYKRPEPLPRKGIKSVAVGFALGLLLSSQLGLLAWALVR